MPRVNADNPADTAAATQLVTFIATLRDVNPTRRRGRGRASVRRPFCGEAVDDDPPTNASGQRWNDSAAVLSGHVSELKVRGSRRATQRARQVEICSSAADA